jgi:hypothetical protein
MHSRTAESIFNYTSSQQFKKMHIGCSRAFAYFTSRYAIVYNPATKQQSFYQGHKFKITAMTVHPSSNF